MRACEQLQIGAGLRKIKNTSAPLQGHFARADVTPKKRLREFRVTPDAILPEGTELDVRHFFAGQLVDVSGTSKGKGFQGVMKRHGFAGGFASHGASKAHRLAGSVGQSQDPGRLWKNQPMAGHMGASRVTVKNLLVYKVIPHLNTLLVVGCIPGASDSWLEVRDAKNKPLPRIPPVSCTFACVIKSDPFFVFVFVFVFVHFNAVPDVHWRRRH